MRLRTKIVLLASSPGSSLITGLHAYLNVNWAAVLNDYQPIGETENHRRLSSRHLPAHLPGHRLHFQVLGCRRRCSCRACFRAFPEMKEALISNRVQAAFIVAPMAIALKAQGVPIKVVYLGHRYGSAVVVRKDGPIKTVRRYARPNHCDSEPLLRRTLAPVPRHEGLGHQAKRKSRWSRWRRPMFPARWPPMRSMHLSWASRFPRRRKSAALDASCFRRANIGRTTCRAFSSCGRT